MEHRRNLRYQIIANTMSVVYLLAGIVGGLLLTTFLASLVSGRTSDALHSAIYLTIIVVSCVIIQLPLRMARSKAQNTEQSVPREHSVIH